MGLWGLAVRRPVTVVVAMAALLVVGYIGYSRLGMDLFPSIKIPFVTVTVPYPGAGPREVETELVKVLEDAVTPISGVKTVTAYASEGAALLNIEFQIGVDPDVAAQDVRDRVGAVRALLPTDSKDPVISKLDFEAIPIIDLALTGPLPLTELRRLADDVVKPRLERVPGVAAVFLTGGLEREIHVTVDARRLEAYGLTLGDLVRGISSEGLNVPAGFVDQGGQRLTVRVPAEFDNLDTLRGLRLTTRRGPVPLRDLAAIEDTFKRRETYTRLNGTDAVALSVQKQADANIVQTSDAVQKVLAGLGSELPPHTQLGVVIDGAAFARESVEDVTRHIFYGGLLAVVVVFLFLRSFRSTVIAATALPTSIISSFGLMYFAGYTLNVLSMLALALAVGMLIDDAIVVIENIYRHVEEGEPPMSAARTGTGEIAQAVTAITMTIVAVFVPIAFMRGLPGQFFRQFGMTVTFAVLVSLLVSLTLTPMLASRVLRPPSGREPLLLRPLRRFLEALDASYRPVLAWALRHRAIVVIIGVVVLIVSVMLIPKLGVEFIPPTEREDLNLTVELPPGTALDDTDRTARRVEDILLKHASVERVLTAVGSVGTGGGFFGGPASGADTALFKIKLKPKTERTQSSWAFMSEMRTRLAELPGAKSRLSVASATGGGAQSPVDVELRGPDLDRLLALAGQAADSVKDIPGLTDIQVTPKPGLPEAHFLIDRTKASEFGLSAAQIAGALRTAVDGTVAGTYRTGGDEYDVRVQVRPEDRNEVAGLGALPIAAVNGTMIPLSALTEERGASGPTLVTRTDKTRTVHITGNLLAGYPSGAVIGAARERIAKMQLPPGYEIVYAGEAQQIQEVFGSILFALGLAVLFVYMILAAQFESFIHPFTISLSLPFSLIGAVLALLLTHQTLNMMSMIGLVMLMGVVTKNAILLVDFTNTLRARGLDRTEAILRAGPRRLRPILMTTAAIVFGMLPIALGIGKGAELRQSMAICVIGGLLSSMFLTLVLVPVVYSLLDQLRIGSRAPAAAPAAEAGE